MKKVVLTLTASLACLAAFAQGKISFQNDSTRLAYYDSTVGSAFASNGVSSTGTPNGATFMADLYMGTTSTSLQLISSTTFGAVPGKWTATSIIAPWGGGTTVFIVAQVRDSGGTPAATFIPATDMSLAVAGLHGFSYAGWSQEFSYPLNSLSPQPMWNASGTWAPATVNMDQYGAGSRGAIAVSAVPEPTSMALLGLGTAAMLIFRRRK